MRTPLLAIFFTFSLAASLSAQRTETRDVGAFDAISVSGSMHTTVKRGAQRIVLKGSADALSKMETTVKNGRLTVQMRSDNWNGGNWKSRGKVEVEITVPELDDISYNGSGKMLVEDRFEADEMQLKLNGSGSMRVAAEARLLSIQQNGSGSMTVAGDAQRVRVKKNGAGNLDAPSLNASIVEVKANGSGNTQLHAAAELHVEANGSGTVKYSGNPSVRTDINGSGSVRQVSRN